MWCKYLLCNWSGKFLWKGSRWGQPKTWPYPCGYLCRFWKNNSSQKNRIGFVKHFSLRRFVIDPRSRRSEPSRNAGLGVLLCKTILTGISSQKSGMLSWHGSRWASSSICDLQFRIEMCTYVLPIKSNKHWLNWLLLHIKANKQKCTMKFSVISACLLGKWWKA